MRIGTLALVSLTSAALGCYTHDTGTDAGTDAVAQDIASADATLDVRVIDEGADTGSASDATSTDGSILPPPADSGDPFTDAGALGEPAWVPIEVRTSGTCAAFTPCAGDVVGAWDVTGACVEVPIESAISSCPGAMVTRADGQARGRVVFDGSFARRIAQSTAEVDVFIPAICANAAGGCGAIEASLRSLQPDSACVATSRGDCNCASRLVTVIDQYDAYRIEGNEIVSVSSGKRWAYCIAGTSLTYQDTSPSGSREPGIIVLGHR